MTETTISFDELHNAANIPDGAEIHDYEWLVDGLRIEYDGPMPDDVQTFIDRLETVAIGGPFVHYDRETGMVFVVCTGVWHYPTNLLDGIDARLDRSFDASSRYVNEYNIPVGSESHHVLGFDFDPDSDE